MQYQQKRTDLPGSWKCLFSLTILTSQTTTKTRHIHTKLLLIHELHVTKTIAFHQPGKTFKHTSKKGWICLGHENVFFHWPYWPSKRQPRHAIFTPNLYLYMHYTSPKQKLLTIPVKQKNIPTKMDTFTRTMQTPFSLNLLNGKSATKTRYVHTHHSIGSEQHSTNTRSPHHYGQLFNWVTQNGWICLHHASALFTKPLDQQHGNQDMIWSHTSFL